MAKLQNFLPYIIVGAFLFSGPRGGERHINETCSILADAETFYQVLCWQLILLGIFTFMVFWMYSVRLLKNETVVSFQKQIQEPDSMVFEVTHSVIYTLVPIQAVLLVSYCIFLITMFASMGECKSGKNNNQIAFLVFMAIIMIIFFVILNLRERYFRRILTKPTVYYEMPSEKDILCQYHFWIVVSFCKHSDSHTHTLSLSL